MRNRLTRRRAIAMGAGTLLSFPMRSFAQKLLTRVIIAQPSEGFLFLPIYVARDRGFFAENGIEAEVVVFQQGNAECMAAVLGGQADVFIGLPAVDLRAREKKQPILLFAATQSQFGSEIILSRDAFKSAGINEHSTPLEKARALRGLTIAVAGPGGATDQLVRHVARFGGLNPDRDLTIVPAGVSNMLTAFGQGRVSGFCLSPPTTTAGEMRLNGVSLLDFATGEYPPLANFLFTAVSAQESWLSRKRNVAEGFVRSIWQSLRFMRDHPSEIRQVVAPFFKSYSREELDNAWERLKPSFPDGPRISTDGIARNLEFIDEVEGKPIDVKPEDAFTNEIVQAVASSFN